MELNQFMEAVSKAACRLGSYWEAKIVVGGILAAKSTYSLCPCLWHSLS